jgi:predicted acetyltransferase
MWVDLQIKHLCTIKIDYEVENELGKLPRDLARTYDQIYKRIQDDDSAPWALKALMWILGAEEPLSPDEWTGGVSWASLKPDGNPPTLEMAVLLDVCQNLVVHDGRRNVMRFAHLSVREFLETKDLDRQFVEMAASACVNVLQHPHTLNSQPTAYADFTPFHRYSIRNWPKHVLRCDDPTPQLLSALSAFLGSFDHPADAYIYWLEASTTITLSDDESIHNVFRDIIYRIRSTPPNPLFAAAYFGFEKVCGHLWEPNTFNPNCTNDAQETLLFVASIKGHTATVRLLLQNGADVNHPTHRDETAPLLAAIQAHNSEVLDLLLDAGAIFNSTEYPSIVLAGTLFGNGAVMQLLLRRDASVEITEAVVTAAAKNRRSGKEVMELLLRRDASVEITEAVVTAAAKNYGSGKEVMELLLQRDARIVITDATVIAAAGNRNCGKEVMELLLQRDASIEITEEVATAAAGNGKEMMELLLQRDASIEITEAIVIAAAGGHHNKEVIELLLQGDAKIEITEAVVTAAARNSHSGEEVMELLLQRDPSIEITEATVSAAAHNPYCGKEILQLLLQREASIEITEEIVIAVVRGQKNAKEVMDLLLQRDDRIEITEAVVTAAAWNKYGGKEVMELLLQRDATIEITEAIVSVAAQNWACGKEILQLLLQREASIEITEAIVAGAVANERSGKEVIDLLLQRDAIIEITEAVVTAAADNRGSGKQVMELLLQTERAIVMKSSLIAAAFFGHQEWFGRLRSKIEANSVFPQNDMQCLTAAIEGGNTPILDACLESSHKSNDTDHHGWTLHMVAIQSRNQAAIERLEEAEEELMQPMPVTRWEVNPVNSQFVSIGDDGTSLVYSGNLPRFLAEFQGLAIAGGFRGFGLSVKGNHPFPPGNIGKNFFEVEVLDSGNWCVINLAKCAPTNSAGPCRLDSAANASYIKTSQTYMAAHQLITVMDIFGKRMTGTVTDRNTARGMS